MSRRLLLRLVVVLVVLGAAIYAGLYSIRPVIAVTAVRRATASSAVPGTVTVRAERTYRVVTEIPGRIVENNLKIGQKVGVGDLLVHIDGRALEIEISQTTAQLESVRKRLAAGSTKQFELENQQTRLAFMEDNLKSNVESPANVDAQRRAVQGIEQAIELEKVELELLQANYQAQLDAKQSALAKTKLHSPIDGVVSRVDAFAGDLVGNGTLIAELVSLTRIVDARISEENFDDVKIGQGATVRLSGYRAEKFAGTVSKLATTANQETQRYIVELTVEAEPAKLVPGMTGEAVITVSERANALLVPRPALIGDCVYVIADGRASRRKVTVGFTALNEAEIITGVAESELVAVDGLDFLSDGTRVRAQLAK